MTLWEILMEMHHEALTAVKDSLVIEQAAIGSHDGSWEKAWNQTERYLDVCRAIHAQM